MRRLVQVRGEGLVTEVRQMAPTPCAERLVVVIQKFDGSRRALAAAMSPPPVLDDQRVSGTAGLGPMCGVNHPMSPPGPAMKPSRDIVTP
jgi:hypothetical protein